MDHCHLLTNSYQHHPPPTYHHNCHDIRLPWPPWQPCAWLEICSLCERQQRPCSMCYWGPLPPWTSWIPRIISRWWIGFHQSKLISKKLNWLVVWLIDQSDIRNFILSPILSNLETLNWIYLAGLDLFALNISTNLALAGAIWSQSNQRTAWMPTLHLSKSST